MKTLLVIFQTLNLRIQTIGEGTGKECQSLRIEDNKDGKFKTIYVNFRNEEDYNEFCELIGQYPSVKSKNNPAIWHPKLDKTANSLLRWIEEE